MIRVLFVLIILGMLSGCSSRGAVDGGLQLKNFSATIEHTKRPRNLQEALDAIVNLRTQFYQLNF